MARPPTGTDVLARYTLDLPAWDAFVHAARAHPHGCRLELRDASDAGRTVVVAADALHVGRERVDLAHFHVHRVHDQGTWLQLVELDPEYLPCPLPLPAGDTALAARLVEHFGAIAAQHTLDSALLAQQAEADRREPTPSNRLLWFVERHFVACLLVLFFVVLPLGAVLAAWVAGD
jgi:hypothetical protein